MKKKLWMPLSMLAAALLLAAGFAVSLLWIPDGKLSPAVVPPVTEQPKEGGHDPEDPDGPEETEDPDDNNDEGQDGETPVIPDPEEQPAEFLLYSYQLLMRQGYQSIMTNEMKIKVLFVTQYQYVKTLRSFSPGSVYRETTFAYSGGLGSNFYQAFYCDLVAGTAQKFRTADPSLFDYDTATADESSLTPVTFADLEQLKEREYLDPGEFLVPLQASCFQTIDAQRQDNVTQIQVEYRLREIPQQYIRFLESATDLIAPSSLEFQQLHFVFHIDSVTGAMQHYQKQEVYTAKVFGIKTTITNACTEYYTG